MLVKHARMVNRTIGDIGRLLLKEGPLSKHEDVECLKIAQLLHFRTCTRTHFILNI